MKKIEIESTWQISIIEFLLGCSIFLVPLWYGSGHLFPFTVAKSLLVIFFAIVMSALFLFWKSENSTTKWSWNPLSLLIGLFGVSITLSALLGTNVEFSFFGSLIDATGLNLLLSAIIIGGMTEFLVKRNPGLIRKYMWLSLGTSMLVALGTYFMTAFPTTSGGSTFGNTSYMAAYFLINICFAIALFVGSVERWKKVFAGIFGVILVLAPTFFNRLVLIGEVSWSEAFKNPLLFAGVSNGATVALAVMIPVIVGLYMLVLGNKQYKKIIGGGLIGIATIGMIGFWVLFQTPGNPINEFFVERKSNNRLIFWDIAKQGIADRPMFGWGMNNYAYVFQEKFSTEFFLKKNVPELWTNNPHNMVLEIGVNHGLLGLGLYLAIYIGAIFVAIRASFRDAKKAPILIALSGALIGYFIQNLFIFDTPGTVLFFWFVIGMILGYATNWRECEVPEKYRYLFGAFLKILAIGLLILLPMLVFKPWKESKAWVKYTAIQSLVTTEKTPQGISRLGYASDTSYIAGRMIDIIRSEYASGINDDQKKVFSEMITRLAVNLEGEVSGKVDNFRARWTLAQLYMTYMIVNQTLTPELIESATNHFDRAMEISPNNAYVVGDKAQLLLLQEKFTDAEVLIKKFLELAPEETIGYTLAETLEKVRPNKEFKEYVAEIRAAHDVKEIK